MKRFTSLLHTYKILLLHEQSVFTNHSTFSL